jgi:hypothetical protein
MVSRKPYSENKYVKIGAYNFDTVKDYTYLGTILTNKNELRSEIENRITYAISQIMHWFLLFVIIVFNNYNFLLTKKKFLSLYFLLLINYLHKLNGYSNN